MGFVGRGAFEDMSENSKRVKALNWAALVIMMVFYAGTWTFAGFYHVTEIYNTLIIFVALVILFFNNVDPIKKLKEGDKSFYLLGLTLAVAAVNLFIIRSNKGCFLILADFLLVFYLSKEIRLTELQLKTLEIFFLVMFASWFVYDRTFSFNANTGATATVFTMLGAYVMLNRICRIREIYGFIAVIAVIRTANLVLWHLARGAFIALFVFLVLFYAIPRKLWLNSVFYRGLTFFSIFGSLLFVLAYVLLSATGINPRMPFFYKNVFSGREQIWMEVWEIFIEQPLTGIGSGRALKSFFEYNIHNAMYDILAVHGVIVFALAVILIIRRLFEAEKVIEAASGANAEKILCAAAVFAIFIESFIDMDLMWADYSPVLLFLLYEIFHVRQTDGYE